MRFVQFLFFRHALARDFSLEPIIYDIWWRFSPPNSESGGTFCPHSGNVAKILFRFRINHKVIFDYLFKSSYMPV